MRRWIRLVSCTRPRKTCKQKQDLVSAGGPCWRRSGWRSVHLRQPGDVEALPVLHRGLAGLSLPGPLPLSLSQAGPGEDVVVGQVQVRRVHRKLADELEQAGQAVQQPLDEDSTA